MIWEQGAVVIVALCRLQENNESACARYWPEDGAEIYHIYEVPYLSHKILRNDNNCLFPFRIRFILLANTFGVMTIWSDHSI